VSIRKILERGSVEINMEYYVLLCFQIIWHNCRPDDRNATRAGEFGSAGQVPMQ